MISFPINSPSSSASSACAAPVSAGWAGDPTAGRLSRFRDSPGQVRSHREPSQYVDKLTAPGSPEGIPVSGGAILQISVGPNFGPSTGSESYPRQHGQPLPGVDITGYQTFTDTRYVDAPEDDVLVGVGVRARLPFRVTQSGDQLIVDVAHSWNASS
ncbi:hypothetical protein AB0D71_28650 [Streptomyces avermitilis]|uniref:AMIN-like domain-containing (lipo)protein n=1 Tax=Streptomyces avermitilis TaxID=33903 RepID=UPI0033CD54A1